MEVDQRWCRDRSTNGMDMKGREKGWLVGVESAMILYETWRQQDFDFQKIVASSKRMGPELCNYRREHANWTGMVLELGHNKW